MDEQPDDAPETRDEGVAGKIGQAIAYLLAIPFMVLLLALALSVPAGVIYAIVRAFPDEVPQQNDSGWLDLILSNQYVVFAARIILILLVPVLVFAGVYISVSIFVRMYKREWLHKAGPFEAAIAWQAERDLQGVEEAYSQMLGEAWEQNEELSARLEAALRELEAVAHERDRLVRRLGQGDLPGDGETEG
jgi:hypothetical protein